MIPIIEHVQDQASHIATKEVDGVIIGKAYYEGRLDLPKMFKLLD